ncbi:hypothetical protein AB0A05_22260 [Streptomyces sp. NPDC046374]|uniref:hypothetical protein n=1 Tax=Streptomyces sp. NPDC046374 TaxID=3154917 RepID=UPI0033F1F9C2
MSLRPSSEDTTDVENADRGFVGARIPGVVKAGDGRVVRNSYALVYLKDAEPAGTPRALPGLLGRQ